MRRIVGLGLSLAAAGAAVLPATAGEPLRVDRPARARDAYRFSVDKGALLVEAPVWRALPDPGALTPEAYAEAALASLERVGQTASPKPYSHQAYSDHRLVAAGDWNGDGKADLVHQRTDESGTVFSGRIGSTGDAVWSWSTTSTQAVAVPAKVGAGSDGVVVFAYSGLGAVAAVKPALDVVALDAAGSVLWSERHHGAWATGPSGARIAVGVPVVGGVGDITPSPADDVVIGKWTSVGALDGQRTRTTVEVVDGVGVGAFTYKSALERDTLVPAVGPDMSGDGLADVLLTAGSLVGVVRSDTGTLLWQSGVQAAQIGAVSVGDITGDGVVDLAVESWGSEDLDSTVLSGADGALIDVLEGAMPVAAGDVDKDGLGDVATVRVERWYTTLRIRLAAFAGRPDPGTMRSIYAQGPTVVDEWDRYTMADVWSAGDLQGDGVVDRAYQFSSYGRSGYGVVAEGAISGHTGQQLWSGRPGYAVGSVDGGQGQDIAVDGVNGVQVKDGATGSELWVASTPGGAYPSAEAAGDVDGDGKGDVTVYATDTTTWNGSARVVSGATGRVLWATNIFVIGPVPVEAVE